MYQSINECCGLAPLSLLIAFGIAPTTAFGQQPNPFFADEANSVQQVSLSKAAEQPATGKTSSSKQLTVSIRYLLVDGETRRSIYGELNPQSIRHSASTVPDADRQELAFSATQNQIEKRVTCYGHSATAVVDSLAADTIVQLATESPISEISQAPSVILQQKQTAEVNDIVQRPMVVDVKPGQDQVQPIVKVVEEGKRMRLLARLVHGSPAAGSIDLTIEFVNQTIVEVKKFVVLGLQETPTTLQHPICAITKCVVSDRLAAGQLLLLDPHIQKNATVEVESTSVLGKLPLVGKSFASTESTPVERHLLILIKPAIF